MSASAERRTAILCMAYGSPETDADVEPYFTHIRGGRPPSAEALASLQARYQAIGRSPLTQITQAQAAALEQATGIRCFVGMKHAPPFIADVEVSISREGYELLVGLPLAPHYAEMSVGAYEAALRRAWPRELIFIRGFHDHPAFISATQGLLREALRDYAPDRLFFTAHSLPARIVEHDDYPGRLLESCRLVAAGLDLPPWECAYQSASHTGEPWLGPDLLGAIERSGAKRALVCPIGFVADHLEILFDLDVEAQAYARGAGVELRRTRSFNDHPDFVAALSSVVDDALAAVAIGR